MNLSHWSDFFQFFFIRQIKFMINKKETNEVLNCQNFILNF